MTDSRKVSELLEPLEIALRLEQEGRQFFLEAASTVTGRVARQTFEFLAGEEEKHIKRIQEFYKSLELTGGQQVPEVEDSDADRRLVAFNDRMALLKDEIKPSLSDVEAYLTALKFENGTEEFYSRQIESATDVNIKRFYRWLINEEAMHAKVLQSCVQFARDPAAWFKKRQ
ncbi:MAG: ferritin family protein [Candidatus Zixiibacteriota bacterium]